MVINTTKIKHKLLPHPYHPYSWACTVLSIVSTLSLTHTQTRNVRARVSRTQSLLQNTISSVMDDRLIKEEPEKERKKNVKHVRTRRLLISLSHTSTPARLPRDYLFNGDWHRLKSTPFTHLPTPRSSQFLLVHAPFLCPSLLFLYSLFLTCANGDIGMDWRQSYLLGKYRRDAKREVTRNSRLHKIGFKQIFIEQTINEIILLHKWVKVNN